MELLHHLFMQYKLARELFTAYFRIVRGMWKIEKLAPPRVTIFGGAKVLKDSVHAQQAHMLGRMLIERGFSVITGGGPGIMEAANCGAYNKDTVRTHSIGIPVEGVNNEKINQCVDTVIPTTHFFIRKWLLMRSAVAFAIFPGGFGTLDELAEVLTLMQTNKLKRFPVVLIDRAYWKHLIEWAHNAAEQGLIAKEDIALLRVTDDIQEACNWLSLCANESQCSL